MRPIGLEGFSVINVSISQNDAQNPSGQPTLVWQLRDATRNIHQQLHGHAGFSAIKDGTITADHYLCLVKRLYGFHASFEQAAGGTAVRTTWLIDDLLALGETPASWTAILRCAALPDLATANQRLGARYVVEGSALGGREMAQGLDHLLGPGVIAGRRFFLGHGAKTGEVWRQSLAMLADAPTDLETQTEIVNAAVATFSAFDRWAAGWSVHTDEQPG